MSLEDYAWSDALAASLEPDLEPARVVLARGHAFRVVGAAGELDASVAGRLKRDAAAPSELPAIGDWVGLRDQRIEQLLPRRTRLSRKVSGRRTEEQIVAANVDTVIVVMGLDGDFSPRRLERYLTTVWESGATPVVLLNKADVSESLAAQRDEVDSVAMGVPVLVSSCVQDALSPSASGRIRPAGRKAEVARHPPRDEEDGTPPPHLARLGARLHPRRRAVCD